MTNLCSTLQTLHRNLLSDSESEIDDVAISKLRSPIIAEHRRRHESSSSDGRSSTDRMFIPKSRDRFRSSSCDTRGHAGKPEYIHCRCCGLLKKAKVSFSDDVGDDDTPEEKENPKIPRGCETKIIPRRSGSCDPSIRNRDNFQAVIKPGQTVSDTEFLARRQTSALPRYEDVVSDGDRRWRGRRQTRHPGRPPPAPQTSSQRRHKPQLSHAHRQQEPSPLTVADVMPQVLQKERNPCVQAQQYPHAHNPSNVVPDSSLTSSHGPDEQEPPAHSPCWTQDQMANEPHSANDTDIPIELMPSYIPEERSRSRRRPNECDPAINRSHIERGVSFKIAVDNHERPSDRPKDVFLKQARDYASEGSQWSSRPPRKPGFTEHSTNLTRTVHEQSSIKSGSSDRSLQWQSVAKHPNSVYLPGGKVKENTHQRTPAPAAASLRPTELCIITPSSEHWLERKTQAYRPHRTPSPSAQPHATECAVNHGQEHSHTEEQSLILNTPPTKRYHLQRTSSPIRAQPCPVEPIPSVRNDQSLEASLTEHRPRTSSLSAPSRPSHLTISKSTYEQSFQPETSSTPLCSRPPKPPPKNSPDKPPARPPKPLKLQSPSHSGSPDGISSTNNAKQPHARSDEPPALPPRGRPPRQPTDKPPERPPKSWVGRKPLPMSRESSDPPPLPPRTRRAQSVDSVFRKREATPGMGEQRRTASEGESQKLIMEVLV
ncbi:proline-rich extensin-like protein EPR1 [Haliotis rufescens]|uniref:proline-rich extensin-like protein EPR1 n=1 Tax=Haliotis rufescens TaxID=6454 RepID=UPI00201EBF24|nr:proline-rich extensin-like protein EPR1 [Haliotis rufescens]